MIVTTWTTQLEGIFLYFFHLINLLLEYFYFLCVCVCVCVCMCVLCVCMCVCVCVYVCVYVSMFVVGACYMILVVFLIC